MSSVPFETVSSFADVQLGKMLDARRETGRHSRPYLRNANVRWFEFDLSNLAQMDFDESERRKFSLVRGDVLVCEGGEPGRAAVWNEPLTECYFQKALHRVRLDEAKCLPNYFVRALRAAATNGDLARLTTSATIAHLTRDKLLKLRVPLPPLDEQRRIADVLDRADALRAKRRETVARLDELTQSIFVEMFGAAKEEALLGDVCTRITDGTHQAPKWSVEGLPFLFVSNIVSGEIDFDVSKFISEQTWQELTSRCPIEVGDVLYSTVGSYGVPAVVRSGARFAFQRHIAHLKPKDSVLPDFLAAALRSEPLRRQADRAARGVAQKTINLAEIRKFRIPLPAPQQQQVFVDRLADLRRISKESRASDKALDDLFASLQQRAFRGDLFDAPLPAELARVA